MRKTRLRKTGVKSTVSFRAILISALMLGAACMLSSCCSTMDDAAATVKTIRLDFKNRQFPAGGGASLASVRHGDFFRIEIDSINLNLYTVTIGKTDSAASTPLQAPTFATLGIADMTKLLIPPLGGGFAPLDKANRTFAAAFPKPLQIADSALRSGCTRLQQIKHGADSVTFEFNRVQLAAQIEDPAAAKNFEAAGHSPDTLYRKLGDFRERLFRLSEDATNDLQRYNAERMSPEAFSAAKSDSSFKSADAYLVQGFNALAASIAQSMDSLSAQRTFLYVGRVIDAENGDSHAYRSLPLQFSKDRTSLDIKIQPKAAASSLEPYETVLTLPPEDCFFWGASSGLYRAQGLKNEAYSVKQNIDSTYSLVGEQAASTEIGIEAMVHCGYQLPGKGPLHAIGFDIGFGPGMSISDKVKPRLLASAGLALGNRHKLLLSYGAIAGYADKLSNAFDLSSHYLKQPGSPTVSVLRYGEFLSIGYLFY
jgi:hypothetical protein